jgi:hypothetical protein
MAPHLNAGGVRAGPRAVCVFYTSTHLNPFNVGRRIHWPLQPPTRPLSPMQSFGISVGIAGLARLLQVLSPAQAWLSVTARRAQSPEGETG